MVYTFGLVKHANIRYRDSLNRLGLYELVAMLRSLSLADCEVKCESLGGADFLTFECPELSEKEISYLSGHSSVVFIAEKTNGLLRPISFRRNDYLEEDLPEILKYKGKTSPSFLRLMINIALSHSSYTFSDAPVHLLDPLCGKATACFCALQMGMNATGIDLDRKAIRETVDYFRKYLQFHGFKHDMRQLSETYGKNALSVNEIVFADTRDHYQAKQTRTLRIAAGDTSLSPVLCRRMPVHLIVTDLPYGIQHAPQTGNRPESFISLLRRALPKWKKILLPGGIAALSFNTLTLPADRIRETGLEAGFEPVNSEECLHLRHEVEQAVVRDVVFLRNSPVKEVLNHDGK